MTESSRVRFRLRLAQAFANEALRMAVNPLPCWGQLSDEDRRAHADRCLDAWNRSQRENGGQPAPLIELLQTRGA